MLVGLKQMSLFSETELSKIRNKIEGKEGVFLITFRNRHGPTRLNDLWREQMAELGHAIKCLSWWSKFGNMGLLECETKTGLHIYGQWALADRNELLGVFKVDHEEVKNIRNGFDAGNVTSPAMRAIRIGETGGGNE